MRIEVGIVGYGSGFAADSAFIDSKFVIGVGVVHLWSSGCEVLASSKQ